MLPSFDREIYGRLRDAHAGDDAGAAEEFAEVLHALGYGTPWQIYGAPRKAGSLGPFRVEEDVTDLPTAVRTAIAETLAMTTPREEDDPEFFSIGTGVELFPESKLDESSWFFETHGTPDGTITLFGATKRDQEPLETFTREDLASRADEVERLVREDAEAMQTMYED